MSDLIRREDALRVTLAYSSSYSAEQAETAIRALPAAQPDPREAALRDIARQQKTDEMDTECDVEYADFEGGYNAIIDVARVALRAVQPDARVKEYEEAYQYALHLAETLRENFPPNPDFRFLGDLVGLLTQIDNMVAGLSRPAAGEGDSYENEAAERAVWNILTNPSLTLDPDQMREDRDERARLAREDDR